MTNIGEDILAKNLMNDAEVKKSGKCLSWKHFLHGIEVNCKIGLTTAFQIKTPVSCNILPHKLTIAC